MYIYICILYEWLIKAIIHKVSLKPCTSQRLETHGITLETKQ
jgi:hypothetical protein